MKHTSRSILPALTLLVGASLLALPAAAQEPAPGRAATTDADWAREARAVDFSAHATGFDFQSHRASDLGEDLIQATFEVEDATYEYEFISTEPDNTSTIRLDVTFVALVEFEDRDRDGRYGLGDEAVRRIPLADHPGAVVNAGEDLAGGTRTVTVTYPLADDGDGGLPPLGSSGALDQPALALGFLMTSEPFLSGGDRVNPTQQPITVRITDYPYDENATGTRLALEVRLTTPAVQAADADALRAQDGFFDVVFGWDETASADDVNAAVGVKTLSDLRPGEGTLVTFSYLRADQVEHDLSVRSVRYDAQALPDLVEALMTGDWRIYGIGMLFSVAVVGGPAYLRLRRGG